MDGLYVFNNPWSVQSNEKHTSHCAMMRLGLPIPETWLVPPKRYDPQPDLQVTLERYARLFDLGDIGDRVGYPMFMKPYDGGGWRGVSRIGMRPVKDEYDQRGTASGLSARRPHDHLVRCSDSGTDELESIRPFGDSCTPLHRSAISGGTEEKLLRQ